jgi:hypothetical protein
MIARSSATDAALARLAVRNLPGHRRAAPAAQVTGRNVGQLRAGCGMSNAKFISNRGKSWVGSPHMMSPDDRGSQQVHIDPANAAAKQSPLAYKLHHFAMGNHGGLVHLCIRREKLCAATSIADQEFSKHHIVPNHLITGEKVVKGGRVGLAARQKPDPNGSIDQDHQAALRLVRLSRRRGTSRA